MRDTVRRYLENFGPPFAWWHRVFYWSSATFILVAAVTLIFDIPRVIYYVTSSLWMVITIPCTIVFTRQNLRRLREGRAELEKLRKQL